MSIKKIKQAIGLLNLLSQGEQDVVEGKFLPLEEFFKILDRDFDQNGHE